MTPDLVPAAEAGILGNGVSALFVMGVTLALVALWAHARLRAAEAARRVREAARLAASDAAPLAEGPAVIHGPVEMAHGEGVAVRVEVDQAGTEAESSGSWSFSWKEKDRRVTMRPFYVVHASGTRVRVEPKDRAFLVDAMDGMIVVNDMARTRYAELSPGEEVYAVGTLRRAPDPEAPATGYRDGKQGWVMRPRGDQLLLSSEPLEKRFLRRAVGQRITSWIVVLCATVTVMLFSPYLIRMMGGRDEIGTVVDRWESSDSDNNTSYGIRVHLASDADVSFQPDTSTYNGAPKGSRVRLRYVRAVPSASILGEENGVHGGTVAMALVGLVVLLIVRRIVRRHHEAWYERPVVDQGSGRLAENRGTTSM